MKQLQDNLRNTWYAQVYKYCKYSEMCAVATGGQCVGECFSFR